MGLEIAVMGKANTDSGVSLEAIGDFIHENEADKIRSFYLGEGEDGLQLLSVQLSPAAQNLQINDYGDGTFFAINKTSTVGPGYHAFICDLLHRIASELGIEWQPEDPDAQLGDDTGYFYGGEFDDLQQSHLDWLQDSANYLLSLKDEGYTGLAMGMQSEISYETTDLIITPMGSRNEDWLWAISKDANAGRDYFVWFEEGETAEYYRNIALHLMWTDVRWREPFNDEESAVNVEVHRSLSRAFDLDADIPLPVTEWRELAEYNDFEGDTPSFERMRSIEFSRPIGYRRNWVRSNLPLGWSVKFPGDFAVDNEEGRLDWYDEDSTCTLIIYSNERPFEEVVASAEDMHRERGEEDESLRLIDEDYRGFARIDDNPEEGTNSLVGFVAGRGTLLACIFTCPPEKLELIKEIWKTVYCRPRNISYISYDDDEDGEEE